MPLVCKASSWSRVVDSRRLEDEASLTAWTAPDSEGQQASGWRRVEAPDATASEALGGTCKNALLLTPRVIDQGLRGPGRERRDGRVGFPSIIKAWRGSPGRHGRE